MLQTVVSIVGTRPEAIKMVPVVAALARHPGLEPHVILTGQHAGLADSFHFLPERQLYDLAVDPAEQSTGEIREAIHHRLCAHLARRRCAMLLVQGDTSSALAGALAARDCGIPLGHVEAGLRSFDLRQPWPEEANRIAIDELAHLLFAPNAETAANLEAEPRVRGDIHVTGNTGIDALLAARGQAHPPLLLQPDRRTILLTCHRRENRGEPFARVADACRRIVADLPVRIVMPLHTNRHARRAAEEQLGGVAHIHLIEPVGYAQMVALMEQSWAAITDSGGIQEEAPALGLPVLVLRAVTERPEALASNAALVGTDPDLICSSVTRLLEDRDHHARMSIPSFPFGDGKAAPRIAQLVARFLSERSAAVA